MSIYVKFTKATHQIWSRHVTLASNSEIFYFSPNFVLNFRKSYQVCGKLAQEQKRYRQKNKLGVGKTPPPPSAYRVKMESLHPLWKFRGYIFNGSGEKINLKTAT